jgi:hypothetical protein
MCGGGEGGIREVEKDYGGFIFLRGIRKDFGGGEMGVWYRMEFTVHQGAAEVLGLEG